MKEVETTRLPVACPNPKCGAEGWVPINRLDSQMVCRACGTRFHMEYNGSQMKIGTRPSELVDPLAFTPYQKQSPLLIERVESWWRKSSTLKKRLIKAAVYVPILAAISVWVYATYFRPGPKLPKDLRARATYAVKAIAAGDRERLALIADPATLGDMKAWLAKIRPSNWPRKVIAPKATIEILSQNSKAGVATIRAGIESPLPPPPPPEPVEPTEPEKPKAADPAETAEKAADPDSPETKSEPPPEPKQPPKPPPPVIHTVYLCWSRAKDGVWLLDLKTSLSRAK